MLCLLALVSPTAGFISGRLSEWWEDGKQKLSVCVLFLASILFKAEGLTDSSLRRLSKVLSGPPRPFPDLGTGLLSSDSQFGPGAFMVCQYLTKLLWVQGTGVTSLKRFQTKTRLL